LSSARRTGILARRLTAQMLAGPPASDPLAVAERLLATQAQDPRGARLAIRARSRGVSIADIDRALSSERSLIITWLNRGTLHLVRAEDYGWLHALTTPQLMTTSTTRLAQEGIKPARAERAMTLIASALSDDGPLTRTQLRERLERAGVPTAGQALIHLLFRATLLGIAVRGPLIGREHAYVLTSDWLGSPAPVPRETALAELARRYLVGHAPASDRDLAQWAGLPLRDARAGLEAIASSIAERADGLLELSQSPDPAKLPPPRLLGAFEPLLLGWTSRQDVLGEHETAIVRGGMFRGFALAGGRAVAQWRFAGHEIELEPFSKLSSSQAKALERDAQAIRKYFGWA
jgi:hypothetical protein